MWPPGTVDDFEQVAERGAVRTRLILADEAELSGDGRAASARVTSRAVGGGVASSP